jgi:glycosyltransferase involved in cell wall biosynthesis
VPEGLEVYRTKAMDWFRVFGRDKSSVPSSGFARADKNRFRDKVARFVRGNFFIPDPRRGWNRCAFKKACELINEKDIDTVITTSPPHSTQLIGLRLKKRFPQLRWIADFRDPWTEIYYYNEFYHLPWAKWLDKLYEKRCLAGADKVVTVGDQLADQFTGMTPAKKDRISVIRNGFDHNDFSDVKKIGHEILTIAYTGTLSDAYRIEGFIAALGLLNKKGIRFSVRITGIITEKWSAALTDSLPSGSLVINGYSSHSDSVSEIESASALLLVIPDRPGNEVILTGKLFEYIATGKPVICIGPTDGDAAEIVKSRSNGLAVDYDEESRIADFLTAVNKKSIGDEARLPEEYSRLKGAEAYAELIKSVR